MAEPMRIHRALARAGIASRRQVELMVAAGRVTVNGTVARVGQSIDPSRDRVLVDGQPVSLDAPKGIWFVLNKPAGTMTTKKDPEGRRTVFDLLPPTPGLTYVGRLDFLTEGVLLLTTDGDAAHKLTHPSTEIERVYVATVTGNAKEAADEARQGIELDDGPVKPAWVMVQPLENRRWAFEICLHEGRTREVRRICAALGLEVERLVRTQFGPVRLGELESGKARPLSGREIQTLEGLLGRELGVKLPSPSQRRRDREKRERGSAPREGPAAEGRPKSRSAASRPGAPRDGARAGKSDGRTGGRTGGKTGGKTGGRPGSKPAGGARSGTRKPRNKG